MTGGSFNDLLPRVMSGVALALVGALVVWAGGVPFLLFITLATGLMVWELASMLAPGRVGLASVLGAAAAAAFLVVTLIGGPGLAALAVPALGALAMPPRGRIVFGAYGTFLLVAGLGLFGLRESYGPVWMLWFLLVVIVTDIAGYFAGRIFGGPKFWPRISPKKTWSGTIAGWAGAALVGFGFTLATPAGVSLVVLSVVLSFASQMGDIAESAIKRFAGVKDSSNLIPGHGGLMDRFDGVTGASVAMLLILSLLISPFAGP